MSAGGPAEFVLTLGAMLPFAALVVSAFLGAYVLGLNPRGSANRSAFLVMLAFIIWDLGEIVQRSFAPGTSPDALFFWAHVTWIGIVLVPATLYHLALTYPSRSAWFRGPWALAVIYAPFAFWAYGVTSTNLIISGMSANAFGPGAHISPTYANFAPFSGAAMFPAARLSLVLGNGRSAGMGGFRDVGSATSGLCITGLAPTHVEARFGLERTPILWITTASSTERTVRPNGLDFELVHTVVKFLRENPGTAVLLDDLDYLAAVAGFDAVGRFLKRVVNQASASKGTVIVAAGQGTFTPDQVAVLRGSVDRLVDIQEAPNPTPNGTTDHVLMTINAQDASVALPLVGARRGLLLTTEHPSKARVRYGDRFDIVWVTDHPEPGTPTVRPKALDTEGRRAIANYASVHAGSDIVLVGLDQLALYVDVRAWLPFVKDALDIASLHSCRLFLTVAPETMRTQELAMLSRRFDAPLGAAALKTALPSGPTTTAPESRIPYRGPSA